MKGRSDRAASLTDVRRPTGHAARTWTGVRNNGAPAHSPDSRCCIDQTCSSISRSPPHSCPGGQRTEVVAVTVPVTVGVEVEVASYSWSSGCRSGRGYGGDWGHGGVEDQLELPAGVVQLWGKPPELIRASLEVLRVFPGARVKQ